MWPELVVVSTPFLHFRPCIVKTHEPVSVQALRPELAIEGLDEAVVRRLARPGEVEDDALLISPEVEVPRDELGALIYTDRLGIADAPADPLERQNDVLSPIAEARIHRRREPREGVHDGEDTDLPARGQLVMHEVHRPCLVDLDRVGAVLAQLRLHAPFGNLVAQLQAHLLVQAIDPLRIDRPAVAPQQNMDAPVAVTDACLADISNALLQVGLAAPLGLVDIERSVDPKG